MLTRVHRWSKRILVLFAALPVFQAAGGCDTTGLSDLAVSTALSVGTQINVALFQSFVGSVQQTLLRSFPSLDILQILLGANRQPFFP